MSDLDEVSAKLTNLLEVCQTRLLYALEGTAPLINTVMALRGILRALEYPTHSVDHDTVRRLTSALFHLGPPIAVNVSDDLPVERVIFSFAAAAQLVSMF